MNFFLLLPSNIRYDFLCLRFLEISKSRELLISLTSRLQVLSGGADTPKWLNMDLIPWFLSLKRGMSASRKPLVTISAKLFSKSV